MAEKTGLDPRCFTPASTFSGAIERIKSKVILTCPRDIEIVDLVESLFSGGYSSVHTRLGFDTEMFTPESAEYIKERDEIIDQVRNLCGEKLKRKIRGNLTRSSMTYLNRRILRVVTDLFVVYLWMGRRRVRNAEFSQKSSSSTKTISTVSL